MKPSSRKIVPNNASELNLSGRSILVTGATGFIGANLCRRLLQHGAVVHIVRRPSSSMWRLNDIENKLVCHTADLADYNQLAETFDKSQPEAVFHLATERGTDLGARMGYVNTSILGAVHLINLLSEAPTVRMIASGSSTEYAKSDYAIPENYPLLPDTLHGVVKASASLLYRQAVLEDRLSISQLRLFHVYGPWESSHRFLPTAINLALNKAPVPLTASLSRRDWIHVDDVVEAFLTAVQYVSPPGIYNIASGIEYSNEQVLDILGDIIGNKIERIPGAMTVRPTDRAHRFADISLALREIGWSPKYDLRTGIENTLEWNNQFPDAWQNEGAIAPIVF